jgi:flagellar basal-body rod protein FlgB
VAHPVLGLIAWPDGNNVSLEREGLLSAETQLRYNIGVELMRDTFHMLSSAIHEGSTS